MLYASVWLSHDAPPTSDAAKLGAYRMVTAEMAKERWYKGVPEDKRADLIPPGWFDKWQQATWATDPKAASANPPALRAPNGVTQDIRGYYMSGKATYDRARSRRRRSWFRRSGTRTRHLTRRRPCFRC